MIKMLLFSFTLILSVVILQGVETDSKIYNTCGFSKEDQPRTSKDCTTFSIDYGGKCCFVEFLKQPNEDTNTTYYSFSTCLQIPSYNTETLNLAQMAAHNLSYSIVLECYSKQLSSTILLLFLLLITIII